MLSKLKKLLWNEQWNIAVAHASPSQILTGHLPSFTWIPNVPKGKFYADPFVFAHEGKTYIFFEEYADSAGKGWISYVEVTWRNGSIKFGPIKKVIEENHHLSYPFIFTHENQIYCLPESGESGKLTLYRAKEFPNVWEKSKTLLENFPAIDATLLKHQGRWWIFSSKHGEECNSTLYAFHSEDLFGGWTAHAQNPLKNDITSARPAGMLFEHKGKLYRPSQNSQGTYGKEIVINEIIKLTPDEFEEKKSHVIGPISSKYPHGVHTISHHHSFVVMDGKKFLGLKKFFHPVVAFFKNHFL